jgi:hypothetical protein
LRFPVGSWCCSVSMSSQLLCGGLDSLSCGLHSPSRCFLTRGRCRKPVGGRSTGGCTCSRRCFGSLPSSRQPCTCGGVAPTNHGPLRSRVRHQNDDSPPGQDPHTALLRRVGTHPRYDRPVSTTPRLSARPIITPPLPRRNTPPYDTVVQIAYLSDSQDTPHHSLSVYRGHLQYGRPNSITLPLSGHDTPQLLRLPRSTHSMVVQIA